MRVIFLGTNGWYSTVNNTTSTLIETEDYYIILDAGDGLHKLDDYIKDDKPILLFLSHVHLDHIIGFHVFNKFKFKQDVKIIGYKGTKENLYNIIKHPYTSPFEEVSYKIEILEVEEKDYEFPIPFSCKLLVHSDNCLGFRLKLEKKIISYCIDTGVCDALYDLSNNADLLISECSYKVGQEEWGWPHLKPEEIATVARKNNVKMLILTHFDPTLFPTLMSREKAVNKAKQIFKATLSAYDGFELTI